MVPLKKLRPTILLRKGWEPMGEVEFEHVGRHFTTSTQRTEVRPGSLVIPRYEEEWYHELCVDLRNQRARCINNSVMHEYITTKEMWSVDVREVHYARPPTSPVMRAFVAYSQVFASEDGFRAADDAAVQRAIGGIGGNANFYAVDVCEGGVMNILDGCSAALGGIDPSKFYANLAEVACMEQYNGG